METQWALNQTLFDIYLVFYVTSVVSSFYAPTGQCNVDPRLS